MFGKRKPPIPCHIEKAYQNIREAEIVLALARRGIEAKFDTKSTHPYPRLKTATIEGSQDLINIGNWANDLIHAATKSGILTCANTDMPNKSEAVPQVEYENLAIKLTKDNTLNLK